MAKTKKTKTKKAQTKKAQTKKAQTKSAATTTKTPKRLKKKSTKVAKKTTKTTKAKKPRKVAFDYDGLVREARAALELKLERGKTEFGMGSYQRFNVDQTRAVMEFSDDGVVKLSAKAQVVGSYSSSSESWMWSWANDSLLTRVKKDLARVRAFGKTHGIKALTAGVADADEADAWTMMAVSAHILGSECAYRIPNANGAVFILLSGLTKHAVT